MLNATDGRQENDMTEYPANSFPLIQVSPRCREKLLSIARSLHFDEGEYIFREGDRATNLFILKSGDVSLESHIPPHGRRVLTTLDPGEWFGWSALIEPKIETAAARAAAPCEVLAIRGGELMDLCHDDIEFGFEIYRALVLVVAHRLMATRLQMLDMFATS
jgi:CRP-like cAMP-binding protein